MTIEENNLETNEDLQRFIAELQGSTEEESTTEAPVSDDEETLDDSNTESDSSAQSDDGVSSGDSDSEDDTGSEEETKPVEERLSEVQRELGINDELTPEDKLKQHETALQVRAQQLQQTDILAGLPNNGIYAPEGNSIYGMAPEQLNQYLIELRDSGRELEAGQVQQAYITASQNVKQYVQAQRQLEADKVALKEHKNFTEWQTARTEWLGKLPEVEPYIPTVAQYIDQKAAQDPVFAFQIENYNGKMRAILQAFRDLGFDKELSKKQPKAQINTPSAPEARAASKKVTSSSTPVRFTAEQIGSMSMTEYLKNEAEIDKLMAQGLIK